MYLMPIPHADTQYARRLAALIDHLGMTQTEFAAATGLDVGYLGRILKGERAKGARNMSKLHEKVAETLGIGGHYWTAKNDVPLEKAYVQKPQQGGNLMAVITGPQMFGGQKPSPAVAEEVNETIKAKLVQYAAQQDESGELIKELAKTKVPAEADIIWWVRTWDELTRKHPRPAQ